MKPGWLITGIVTAELAVLSGSLAMMAQNRGIEFFFSGNAVALGIIAMITLLNSLDR